jgi:hypothetical protein
VAGDDFSEAFISASPPAVTSPPGPAPDLKTLQTLNPLKGRVSAIHASSFFHLFEEEDQAVLARRLASLLSPESGSVLFGGHGAKPEKGYRAEGRSAGRKPMFCHSPESWTDMWYEIFEKGTVKVEAVLEQRPRKGQEDRWVMVWSVTRL